MPSSQKLKTFKVATVQSPLEEPAPRTAAGELEGLDRLRTICVDESKDQGET